MSKRVLAHVQAEPAPAALIDRIGPAKLRNAAFRPLSSPLG